MVFFREDRDPGMVFNFFNGNDNLEMLYEKGMTYCKLGRYDEAEDCFDAIIKSKEKVPFLGGAYVNLAQCYLMNQKYVNLDNETFTWIFNFDSEIKNCLNEALKIKSENQVAMRIYSVYYFMKGEYYQSIEYLFKMKDLNHIVEVLDFYGNTKINVTMPLATGKIDVLRNHKKIEAYEKIIDKFPGNLMQIIIIKSILLEMYILSGEYLKAYSLIHSVLEEDLPGSFHIMAPKLAQVCGEGYLRRFEEQQKICLEGMKKLKEMKLSKKYRNDFDLQKRVYRSNLVSGYMSSGKNQEALEILKRSVKKDKNNTDLHNLAGIYYELKEYKEALRYILMANKLQEDESGLSLLAAIYYEMGDYNKAFNYYEKALRFMEEIGGDFIASDPKTSVSVSNADWDYHKKLKIYVGLMQTSIMLRNYETAEKYYNKVVKKWPRSTELAEINVLLKESYILEGLEKAR